MKKLNRFLISAIAVVMLVFSFSFANASAADKTYVFTVENTCVSTVGMNKNAGNGSTLFAEKLFTDCYGSQLEGTAKDIYDSLVKHYSEDKKTGSYHYSFKEPFTFKAEVSDGIILDTPEFVAVKKIISDAQQMALDTFLYDCPEVFWFKIMHSSYSIVASYDGKGGWNGKIEAIEIIPTEIYSGASLKISQFDAAVDAALSSIAVTENRYQTLKNIHDYICDIAFYNLAENNNSIYTAEPFFIGDRGVVCEGYAKTFKIFCDRLGIPCALVSGNAGGNHMWNHVKMEDGRWYLVDATWDDQESGLTDRYFIANANTVGFNGVTLSEERTVRTDLSGTGVYNFVSPVLSAEAYTSHTHQWESEYTVDKEPDCINSGSKSIHCSFCYETKSVTVIEPLDHDWNDGTVSVASTCKVRGTKIYTCLRDSSHTKSDNLPLDQKNHRGGTYLKSKKASTCTAEGYTGDSYCSDCNQKLSSGKKLSMLPHNLKTTVTKANFSQDGKTEISCSCGYVKSTKTVYALKSVKLSSVQYTYNGKVRKPKVTVKDRKGNVLKEGRDYTVVYAKGRKLPGKYSVKVNFNGNSYNVSVSTSFTIIPSKVTLSKLTAASKSATLTWKTVSGVTGYEVEYSTSKNFKNKKKVTLKKASSKKTTVKKLKKGKKYYFRVRAYKAIDGKKVYGSRSSVKSIKIK